MQFCKVTVVLQGKIATGLSFKVWKKKKKQAVNGKAEAKTVREILLVRSQRGTVDGNRNSYVYSAVIKYNRKPGYLAAF